MGTFAVIRNDGTILVVNGESEADVLNNVLGSSALNYVKTIEPYDADKHLTELEKLVAAAPPPAPTGVAIALDQANLDEAIRRVLGLPQNAPVPQLPASPASEPIALPATSETVAPASPEAVTFQPDGTGTVEAETPSGTEPEPQG